MPAYAVLLDDGEFLASAIEAVYPSMSAAVTATLETAALVATDRLACGEGRVLISCEVKDRWSGKRRQLRVELVATDEA